METPIQVATGQLPDISALLQYKFYKPVLFHEQEARFPEESKEKLGYWVGISEHVGDALTFKVLTADTNKVIPRSTLRPTSTPGAQNLRAHPAPGEDNVQLPILEAKQQQDDDDPGQTLLYFAPDELLGRTFLTSPNKDGECFRATITRKILDNSKEYPSNDNIQYLLRISGDRADKIVSYNEAVDQLTKHLTDGLDMDTGEVEFRFRAIVDHAGPFKKGNPEYNGSAYNVLILWETGEKTWEPLGQVSVDNPVTCAQYAKEKVLLDTDGWKK